MQIEKTVLLVDDDKDDLELLEEALKTIDVEHRIIQAHDGEEGMRILRELMHRESLPCLIVLDLNMPRMDGKQTFLAIKAEEKLAGVPIVVFSTSTSKLDRTFFEKHHTAYFVKPVNFTELARTASRMISICMHKSAKR